MLKIKKGLAVLLALTIVFSFTTALAADKPLRYTSPSGNYTAEKFSHPDTGVGEVDGIIEYDSGVNDRGQNYSWSAVGYGDYMYVGTCYAAIATTINIMAKQSGMDPDVFKAGIDALFNGTLYIWEIKKTIPPVRSVVF